MAVRRVVPDIAAANIADAKPFYGDILGMTIVMDLGFIITFASENVTAPQLSVMSQGGSDAPVPDLSIEVDDLNEVLRKITAAGIAIEYGPVTEPWGVRRFFVRDPFRRLVNILSHA